MNQNSKKGFSIIISLLMLLLSNCSSNNESAVSSGIEFEKEPKEIIEWNYFAIVADSSINWGLIEKGLTTYNTKGESIKLLGTIIPEIYQLDHITLRGLVDEIKKNKWDKSAWTIKISRLKDNDIDIYSVTLELNYSCGNLCGYWLKRTRVIYTNGNSINKIIDNYSKSEITVS